MTSGQEYGSYPAAGEQLGTPGYSEGAYAPGAYVPSPPPPGTYDMAPPTQQEEPSTAEVAKDQAGQVAGSAGDAAQHVAGVAKDQATQVAAEATRQVKHMLWQAQSELSGQAQVQQEKLAGGLHGVGDQLKAMATGSDQPGMATDLAHQGADKAHEIASWLERRDPGSVLEEVRAYARRRPGMFLAVALGAGLVAGRLARGLAADPDDTGSSNGQAAPTSPPVQRTPGMVARPAVNYDGPAAALPAHASAGPYGMGAVPDWTGKAGSDVLGDGR